MRGTTLFALLMGVMLYLVMGALVFRTLEAPNENLAYKDLLATKQNFLQNKSCITELDFNKFLKVPLETVVVSAVEAGLDVSNPPANVSSRWTLASAFFFCGTIITTIGFGNLSPQTWYGQLFCVCYALVGIPMFGILLAGVGDHMGRVLRRAVAKIEKLFLKHKVKPTTVRVISAVLSILIGCLIFLAVPTVVFQRAENWTFLESFYFVVITLTTVGFGDYVAGGGPDGLVYKLLVLLWIVFGLAYFASILTMIGNWLRVLSKRTRAEMEELRAHATDWTQNIQNMSMDFRIPKPLEFNDPFLLQRRRWKRSERRRIRRGAQVTLGHWATGGPENGHLPNQWAGLFNSMSQLEAHSSLERFQPRHTLSRMEEGGATDVKPAQEKTELVSGEKYEYKATGLSNQGAKPGASAPVLPTNSTPFSPFVRSSCHPILLPSAALNIASSANCQLLDFFGENLAYIDESSDTLSDRGLSATSEENRRKPRKPKRRSMRRQLSHKWSPLQVRGPDIEIPPSNPPTPPPRSSLSDLPSETQTKSALTL
ncbi:potassium channel subfamily K member 4 isoform X3 [Antennarius striatus]|uniref:potassium channel subfamily K member 4 isoform X3 n=1 Tax=Antennarius striatus TaxID=241820 RepID=UPI0035AFEFD9